MTGVIFATVKEAAPFIYLSGQRRQKDRLPVLFAGRGHDDLFTIISGMGPAAARAAASTAIADHGARQLLNAGICGALRNGSPWRPGAIFAVSRATAIDLAAMAPARTIACDRQAWDRLPAADLVTCDQPLFDPERRDQLAAWGALVDMEGAAVASVARDRGLPCTLIKGVTDLADAGGRADLHRRLESVSRQIAKILVAGLHQPKLKGSGTNGSPH